MDRDFFNDIIVVKRSGQRVNFNPTKVAIAIKKGYNKINLYLGLMMAYEIRLDKVMIACEANNIPSDRTLKALGGVLERSEIDPYDGLLTNVYWFDVLNCLNNYKDKYYPYVYKKQ